MNTLKKIWKDPVGSNIIAAIIFALGTIILTAINSIIQKIEFKTSLQNLLTFKIEIWVLIIVMIFILITFQLIKSLRNKTFKYDNETLKLDRELFNKIRIELLSQNNTIYFLRQNNFAGFSFDMDNINDLYKIEAENVNSDFEFINPELEKIKNELLEHISHFTYIIGIETFTTSTGRQSVPEEWEVEQPERFRRVVHDLHNTSRDICGKYDELIRIGRRILKI